MNDFILHKLYFPVRAQALMVSQSAVNVPPRRSDVSFEVCLIHVVSLEVLFVVFAFDLILVRI